MIVTRWIYAAVVLVGGLNCAATAIGEVSETGKQA